MKITRPSPALVISLIALFVALGGTSYAAITSLPRNSVGTSQIKNGAVTKAKINPAGLTVPTASAPGTLPHGKTLIGTFDIEADAPGAGTFWGDAYSFAFPLRRGVSALYLHAGASPTTDCPGSAAAPKAAPGYLCVYASEELNVGSAVPASPITNIGGLASRYGFDLQIDTAGAGLAYAVGTWAVTAP